MNNLKRSLFSFFLIVVVNGIVVAQLHDWRGAERTGVYNETGLLKQWAESGPELLWFSEGLGMGYSSATVTDDAIYITGRKDTIDVITALNLEGEKLWETPFGKSWFRSYTDARSTPTYYNGKIYLVSGSGEIVCVNKKGKILWSDNHYERFEGVFPRFGVSESPLIVDDKVVVSPGGDVASLVAYDLKSGKLIWKAEPVNEATHYVNPVLVKHGGRELIVTLTENHIIGVDAEKGQLLWKVNYAGMNENTGKRMRKNHANTPIYRNGQIFVCSGYNHTSVMLKLNEDASQTEVVWNNKDIDPHHGGVVLLGDHLFSSNYENNANGDWVCVDWNSGETQWIEEWHNKGSIISADNMLYFYEEKAGNIGLVKPSAEKLDVISEFKVDKGTGPHWSHPVIRDGKMYIRHGEVLMVYKVKIDSGLASAE
ncbi:PQQ-binding-like beta-propeller repeat protein [Carboxylicivirga marina]|uniref:PQQ-like beta-propeller repeat protein n=1 Tax=Carboxylicivirga marina TaxID=2800988 RepID=A0ABS1HHH2_9BACT|nr:PQQ-binding-like beta-propeller repeat protein [Carboxylicivirga marina]MBK3517107.1 PQQ-like beta-propeller repeat protein [Carboxylicivirga marina]